MTQEIVETPVEPLVLSDDRTASISPSAPAVGLLAQMRATSAVDDDDDDAEDEEASDSAPPVATIPPEPASTADATPQVVTSSRVVNPRVDSQNPLVFESELDEGTATKPDVVSQDDQPVLYEPTLMQNSAEVAAESPTPATEPQQPVPAETKATETKATDVDTAPTLELLHELLYQKITENQCSSHAKEIHEYQDQAKLLPQVIRNLSQQFQREAKGQEVSVDIQTSICIIEQMLLPEGRRSPLQDMYTAEEEEMLNQLVHTGSSNNVLS